MSTSTLTTEHPRSPYAEPDQVCRPWLVSVAGSLLIGATAIMIIGAFVIFNEAAHPKNARVAGSLRAVAVVALIHAALNGLIARGVLKLRPWARALTVWLLGVGLLFAWPALVLEFSAEQAAGVFGATITFWCLHARSSRDAFARASQARTGMPVTGLPDRRKR
jgi:chromate transport protein ChrA